MKTVRFTSLFGAADGRLSTPTTSACAAGLFFTNWRRGPAVSEEAGRFRITCTVSMRAARLGPTARMRAWSALRFEAKGRAAEPPRLHSFYSSHEA